jgi:nitrous oxidase accessory protein NosD
MGDTAYMWSVAGRHETSSHRLGGAMRHPLRSVAVAGVAALASTVVLALPAQATGHKTWTVWPGTGTITKALTKANPGDTLKLRPGNFLDSVAVTMPLTIRGSGWSTVIKPPLSPKSLCDGAGFAEGICVAGAVDNNGNANGPAVVGVRVSDLRVTGFSDSGVIGFNTSQLKVQRVKADHNGGYGIARFQSTGSVFSDNRTSWNGEAGLYMGDSPNGYSVVRDNKSDHNGFGIFMRDSTHLTATDNQSWGNCVGILALNSGSGALGDRPAGNYTITDNQVWANNMACPASGGPPTSGIGIALAGVHDTLVFDNTVNGNASTSPSVAHGGIVIISTLLAGGANPTRNTVVDNSAHRNRPADIFWDGSGFGNKVVDNECSRAILGHPGWCHTDH